MMELYEKMHTLREVGVCKEMPSYISENLNPNFELRPYQKEAFENFITYFESENLCRKPTQVLFHMATGSGKTLIMAGLMLYLYKRGYRNFLFFVNLSNIVDKTKVNFMDRTSSKYLFSEDIVLDGERVVIQEVKNFQYASPDKINICFSTTQGLHMDMWMLRESGMTFDDFENQKVVLISDEAHHLNVDTKKKMPAEEDESYHSWEQTVKNIFSGNRENILLEFTATCDLKNPNIKKEYEDKIIFNYPLANFYQDQYSKEIMTLRSDLPLMDRALQAIVLSQYRLKVFQDYRLAMKPIVLFKAAKIAESKEFMKKFIEMIQKLTGAQVQRIFSSTNNPVMNRALAYFEKREISFEVLAQELKDDFSEVHCLSVNDDKDAMAKQLILNSLEDLDNPYRAIFEVKKLDEGWDVLNLFDIVRLYETRQSGGKGISPVTMAEAQLIGRGARYCPFQIDAEQPKFKRKYDNDITNELRVCEELFYHCQNDSKYVNELHQALQEIGIDTDKSTPCQYILKESFKRELLYKEGVIFINERRVKSRDDILELPSSVRDMVYQFKPFLGTTGMEKIVLETEKSGYTIDTMRTAHMTIGEIAKVNYAIVNKAMGKFPIYKFHTLKSYFPNIKSTREFIMGEAYLGKIRIDIQCLSEKPSVDVMYSAVVDVLRKIANVISTVKETYYGTTEFKAVRINEVFRNKTVNYTVTDDKGKGVSQNDVPSDCGWRMDLSREDWFAYMDNYGTSEEKAFVAYFRGYINDLRKKYNKVYLVRNEREFHLYSFDEGERFEPDYVIFLQKDKTVGFEQLQIFVEPKGEYLFEKDEWKEKFLLQMEKKAIPVKKFADDNEYKILGLHFFNQNTTTKVFDEELQNIVKM